MIFLFFVSIFIRGSLIFFFIFLLFIFSIFCLINSFWCGLSFFSASIANSILLLVVFFIFIIGLSVSKKIKLSFFSLLRPSILFFLRDNIYFFCTTFEITLVPIVFLIFFLVPSLNGAFLFIIF